MASITEDLIRKCAEHNECEIFSLEELSLHQRDIKKIEHLDKWCRELKILYLHSNLIAKIENLNRLKKLEYVNFTLNNITRIQNLEGCESLKKLDFTVNFIGELTSIENLQDNFNLEELYLTGNPCSEYDGYRDYVIATLPQLMFLDGEKIKKSERILAMQNFHIIRRDILEQQKNYLKNVPLNSDDILKSLQNSNDCVKRKIPGDDFWKEKTAYTPQCRIEMYKHLRDSRKKEEGEIKVQKPTRRLMTNDGRILNVNEAKLNFEFADDEENNCYKLDLAVYKYLDTSLIAVDVQPTYIRITVKGKYFQLLLPQEVYPDLSKSQRSLSTGHLLITMPKANGIIGKREEYCHRKKNNDQYSEKKIMVPLSSTIMEMKLPDEPKKSKESLECNKQDMKDCKNINFVDDPSVPPLM